MTTDKSQRQFAPKLDASQLKDLCKLIETTPKPDLPDALRLVVEGDPGRFEKALPYQATCSILCDLADQQWSIRSRGGQIWVSPPAYQREGTETTTDAKHRLRQGLLVGRNRQLEEPSVKVFVEKMERPRQFRDQLVTVRDLVDNGEELAHMLQGLGVLSDSEREKALGCMIKPVIEVCKPGKKCEYTGLGLQDIWRYFRHTWSLEYRPTPGRTMQILVRNAARPNSPIIGIAALASPCTRLRMRDDWIGWTVDSLKMRIMNGEWSSADIAQSLTNALLQSLSEIRWDDLVTESDIATPSVSVVERLKEIASDAARVRLDDLLSEDRESEVRDNLGTVDWIKYSERPLFRKKRASTLATILGAKLQFAHSGLDVQPEQALASLLGSAKGRMAIETALGEIRKRGLASNLVEVSVCGAVHPYNKILGGKLVALLLASAQIQQEYYRRYENRPSIISSQMAGRPIIRKSNLLVLTTTSLYAVGSSQYNRLIVRTDESGGIPWDIRWAELGTTEGFGTAHLSPRTVAVLRELSSEVHGVRRINNVFGEGASPRLRQVREGLSVLGLNADDVLRHSTPRIVYGCECHPRAREQLIGLVKGDESRRATVADITAAWIRRWVNKRITRPEVLEGMARPAN